MTARTEHPRSAPAPTGLPSADHVVAHTLLNCLLREVSAPEHQTAVDEGHLLLRLPRRGALLRVALRRTSLLGAHRFTGPAFEQTPDGWRELGWRELAEHVQAELTLRSGVDNEEFLAQLASSHEGVSAALSDRPAPGPERYLESEQALMFGHRFHPAPKSRSAKGADRATWAAYAPEARAAFRLRHLAVRSEYIAQDAADPAALAVIDGLGDVPEGFTLLPTHPWQYELLCEEPLLREAIERGDVIDLGPRGEEFTATASVRTLHGADAFLKFSLNVRITNCLRKNAAYELTGAVQLTRLLAEPLADLAARFPGTAMLNEPAFRTLALPGADGAADTSLFEGFGLIVRDGLDGVVRPGLTPLLSASVADEYATSSAHISQLLDGSGPERAQQWWAAYLRLVVPPVLAAYFDHGVVLEPHLQNVLVCVDAAGLPAQALFRDLEGTKLLPEQNAALLEQLPADVAGPMTYDAQRGWDRVVYCLLVNHLSELLAAVADLHPALEPALWAEVRAVLAEYGEAHGCPPRLAALLAGVPLPAKANLLTRWERKADREAGYVRLSSPLAEDVLAEAARSVTR
ncbi:IucA/IucC family protein [Streptomyces sp. NRRL WC-3742]|uniref:IucA/IucC family protein n=1 Tax=Streptomyces sp. NRRL WC-3742 TaxID=1463934 RepID=UPI0004C6859F|nr:IucA/IucC family protein [Streptomyces sp. NRRL WC-3742]